MKGTYYLDPYIRHSYAKEQYNHLDNLLGIQLFKINMEKEITAE